MSALRIEYVDMMSVTSVQAKEYVDFHNSLYHTSKRPEHWIWEYATYERDKSVFVTARDNGRIIGTQGMMPIYMNMGGERILTGKSESTLLDPKYRGQKIMERVYEYAIELCKSSGYNFIWGFTDAIKAFAKFGFSSYAAAAYTFSRPGGNVAGALIARFKQGDPIVRRIASMGKYVFTYLGDTKNIKVPRISKNTDLVIDQKPIDICKISDFQNALNGRYNTLIALDFDERYVNWRIRRNPSLCFQEYQVLKDGQMQAYAFVAMTELSCNISHLSSLSEIATSLIVHRIIEDNTKAVRFNIMFNPTFMAEHDRLETSRTFGFSPHSNMALVVRNLSTKSYKELTEIDKWNITGLWTEGYWM